MSTEAFEKLVAARVAVALVQLEFVCSNHLLISYTPI